jgi:hypothetical protein
VDATGAVAARLVARASASARRVTRRSDIDGGAGCCDAAPVRSAVTCL